MLTTGTVPEWGDRIEVLTQDWCYECECGGSGWRDSEPRGLATCVQYVGDGPRQCLRNVPWVRCVSVTVRMQVKHVGRSIRGGQIVYGVPLWEASPGALLSFRRPSARVVGWRKLGLDESR
jgi:hypothetical protein